MERLLIISLSALALTTLVSLVSVVVHLKNKKRRESAEYGFPQDENPESSMLIEEPPATYGGAIATSDNVRAHARPYFLPDLSVPPSQMPEAFRHSNVTSPDSTAMHLVNRLIDLFDNQKIYLNPELRIVDVAKMLNSNKTAVSRAVNHIYKMNFSQTVNWYRIRHAIEVFSSNPDISIKELAARSGYQSMTTFNSAFSRHTGHTPAEWCRLRRSGNIV